MEEQLILRKKASCNFEQLAKILGDFSQLPDHLKKDGFIPVATHSMGRRRVTLCDWAKPEFVKDEHFTGEWNLIGADDATYICFESVGSGSRLIAERHPASKIWNIILEVPVLNDSPYKGRYWESFHRVIS